mmetsp:Transcript_51062/g.57896  ORF Transcript_51062/g.57896 Transcript_51062/m.57896 type:complete len:90 (+) Transcript_51062:94-363(+)
MYGTVLTVCIIGSRTSTNEEATTRQVNSIGVRQKQAEADHQTNEQQQDQRETPPHRQTDFQLLSTQGRHVKTFTYYSHSMGDKSSTKQR